MIFWTLALAVVSFIAIALLAPKPELEDARKQDLDPESFPRADLDSPTPLLIGTARLQAPNTLWYGDYEAKKVKETVKTGLFSSEDVVVGYKYYLGIDLGLVLGPAFLKGIYIDSVLVDGVTQDTLVWDEDPPVSMAWTAYLNRNPPSIASMPEISLTATGGPGQLDYTEEDIDSGLVVIKTRVEDFGFYYTGGTVPVPGDFIVYLEFYDDVGDPISGYFYTEAFSFSDGPVTFDVEQVVPYGARTAKFLGIVNPYTIFFIYTNPGYTIGPIEVVKLTSNVTSESFDIYEPKLFGGDKEGGGWVGNINWYPGDFVQISDSYVTSKIDVGYDYPAYRGLAHIVFEKNYIGETPSLRQMEFLLSVFTNNLGRAYGGALNQTSDDACLAEAAYLLLVDKFKGLGLDPNRINIDSFKACADTLQTERNGGSMLVTSVKSTKELEKEILRQIDGIFRQNAQGEIELFLIRDDYVEDDLIVYDEDDIKVIKNYTKSTWEDVRSEVRVSFPTRDTDSNLIALATDNAVASMLGRRKSETITYPLCYDVDLAVELAHRELAKMSVPLFAMEVEMNRNGFSLRPGNVIKVSYSELGLTEIIMRVKMIDAGSLFDNRVIVTLVQDVFGSSVQVTAAPENSAWVELSIDPAEILSEDITMMPFFYLARIENASYGVDYSASYNYQETGVIPFAARPTGTSTGYDMIWGTVTDTLTKTEPRDASYAVSGTIDNAYGKEVGFTTGQDTSVGIIVSNLVGSDTELDTSVSTTTIRSGEGGIFYMNGEWMAYETATDNMDGTWTLEDIHRGLFYSVPVDHPADSRFFFLGLDMLGKNLLPPFFKMDDDASDETVYYKLLDKVAGVTFEEASATELEYVIDNRTLNPYRPRNLKVDAARDLEAEYFVADSVTITWDEQSIFTDQVGFEQDGDEADAGGTITFNLTAYSNSTLFYTNNGITGNSDTVDTTGVDGDLITVYVESVRTIGGDVYTSYTKAWISFLLINNRLELDDGTAGDHLLLSGDAQSGTDNLKVSIN